MGGKDEKRVSVVGVRFEVEVGMEVGCYMERGVQRARRRGGVCGDGTLCAGVAESVGDHERDCAEYRVELREDP